MANPTKTVAKTANAAKRGGGKALTEAEKAKRAEAAAKQKAAKEAKTEAETQAATQASAETTEVGGADNVPAIGADNVKGEVDEVPVLLAKFAEYADNFVSASGRMDSVISIFYKGLNEAVTLPETNEDETAVKRAAILESVGNLKEFNTLFAKLAAKDKEAQAAKSNLYAAFTAYRAKTVHPSTCIGFACTSNGDTVFATYGEDDKSGMMLYKKGDRIVPRPEMAKWNEFLCSTHVTWKAPKVETTALEAALKVIQKLEQTRTWAEKQGLTLSVETALAEAREKVKLIAEEQGIELKMPVKTEDEIVKAAAMMPVDKDSVLKRRVNDIEDAKFEEVETEVEAKAGLTGPEADAE